MFLAHLLCRFFFLDSYFLFFSCNYSVYSDWLYSPSTTQPSLVDRMQYNCTRAGHATTVAHPLLTMRSPDAQKNRDKSKEKNDKQEEEEEKKGKTSYVVN